MGCEKWVQNKDGGRGGIINERGKGKQSKALSRSSE